MLRSQLKLGMVWGNDGDGHPSYIALDLTSSIILGKSPNPAMLWSVAFREERSLWLVWSEPISVCRVWKPDELDCWTMSLVQATMHKVVARGVLMTPLCPHLYETEGVKDGALLPR